jgi:hypothetical protein
MLLDLFDQCKLCFTQEEINRFTVNAPTQLIHSATANLCTCGVRRANIVQSFWFDYLALGPAVVGISLALHQHQLASNSRALDYLCASLRSHSQMDGGRIKSKFQ